MNDPGDFRRALERSTRVPGSLGGLLELFGEDNAAIARELTGIRKRPRDMTAAERRTYRTASRNLQRYRTGERRPRPAALDRLKVAAKDRAVRARIRRMSKRGARAKLSGVIRVSSDTRLRDVRSVEMSGESLRDVAEAIEDDDWDRAAEAFEEAWADSYGIPGDAEIEQLDALELK